jgi:hypothetical protein
MRSSRLLVVAVLAVVLALSAAMPASAHINLLQNPGFETGSLDPWMNGGTMPWDGGIGSNEGGEKPHGGTYFAWIDTEGSDNQGGDAGIWQTINHPQCAEYLEFWYDEVEQGEVNVYYSDNPTTPGLTQDLPPTPGWTFVHVDLDTTKLVQGVETWTQYGGQYSVDDFDLEACPAPAVGGVVMRVNTFVVLAPWLAVIGLVGCIGTIVVVAKKKPKQPK